MKKTLTIMLLAIGMKASAQEQSYEQMSKMQLTKIYLEQVQSIALNAPYASFTMSDTTGVIDMPSSKYLKNKREALSKATATYSKTVLNQLNEIIPYADKNEIIKAILFLENINAIIK